MNILAIETSTEACSVALQRADGVVFSEFELTPRGHTRFLPQMLESVCNQATIKREQINYIAYASGPGAFTGVRIAAATAQGLALGLNVPLVPVSSLAVLAQQACDEYAVDRVVAALDARMGETYCALYHKNAQGIVELQGEEQLINLAMLHLPEAGIGAGSGFQASVRAGTVYHDTARIYPDVYPTATALAQLAQAAIQNNLSVDIRNTSINYIRNQVAEKKATPPIIF